MAGLLGTVLDFLTLLSLFWLTCSNPVSPPECNDPARKQLEEDWGQGGGGNGWHDSFYNVGDLHKHLPDLQFNENVPDKYRAVKIYRLSPSSCPYDSRRTLEKYRNSSGESFQLCPSHDVINYDPNRIPTTVFEKRCSCVSCALNSIEVSGSVYRGGENANCRTVSYPARVLRRVSCKKGVYIYKPILEQLKIGCYCEVTLQKSRALP